MISIGILVFDDVDSIDIAAQYDVFSTAARIHALHSPRQTLFRCYLIAAEMRTIRARGGIKLLPDCVLLPAADIDVLLIPGGNVSAVLEHSATIAWIKSCAEQAMVTAALRSGGLVLARAGLAACSDPDKLLTSKVLAYNGPNRPSAAIELSLHLLQRLAGLPLARATAKEIDYCWDHHGIDQSSATHATTAKATVTTANNGTTKDTNADTRLFFAA